MLPGVQPIAATRKLYVLYDDGSTGLMETSVEEPRLAKPGRFVSEAAYETRLGELRADTGVRVAGLVAGDEERARADFDALTGAGIPEATARRLSGYEGAV
ncbi:hypothetical protein [Streptomyces sp. AMCC400023]|uniref:hypothetical protein n=1 Tax=Streptomyces sp. AMCC400023 TaxID=2056258 RepID=UPI001F198ADC|nr:hypothetical protein [Streptomyces sp. AMCC400023]UJV43003.1 hypothetical protein CVT30_26975 [Streptomyces sp. AMCC400023]